MLRKLREMKMMDDLKKETINGQVRQLACRATEIDTDDSTSYVDLKDLGMHTGSHKRNIEFFLILIYMKNKIHLIEKDGLNLIYIIDQNKIIKSNNSHIFNTIKSFVNDNIKNKEDDDILEEFNSIIFGDNKEVSFDTFDYFEKDNFQTRKITLMLTQDCNLACKYCYGGESGKFNSKGKKMSIETAIKTIEYLCEKSSPDVKSFLITFFGGEPLLNFKVLRETVNYCEKKSSEKNISFGYTLTTNATLLTDEIIDFFKEKNIPLTLSMDGNKEDHDLYRVFPNQQGSYNIVLNNIKKLVDKKVPFIIRATLPPERFDQYDRIYNHLSSLGADDVIISRLSVYDGINNNNIVLPDGKKDNDSLSTYFIEKTKNSKVLNDKTQTTEINNIIDGIKHASHKRIYCGFMKGCTAVTFNGDFYPCHRYVGLDGFVFGNLNSGRNKTLMKNILNNLDLATEKCEKCFGRNICQRNCVRDISFDGGNFSCFSEECCNNFRSQIEEGLIAYYLHLKSISINEPIKETLQNKNCS
jgi:uncharacterized protein